MTETAAKPSGLITQLERHLGYNSRRILDVGCHIGRNTLYLSRFGHSVVGIDYDYNNIQTARQIAQEIGVDAQFAVADARKLPFKPSTFGAVIANEILHLMPKEESQQMLQTTRDLTAPQGFNAISGYFAGSENIPGDAERYLKTNELLKDYTDAGWSIIDYRESPVIDGFEINGSYYVNSLATIIARRNK